MLGRMKKRLRTIKRFLTINEDILQCNSVNLGFQKQIALSAVENFYLNINLPQDRLPHCRFITKKYLLDLYEKDIIYEETSEKGCVFRDLEHDIRLFIPFVGFNEYIGLCSDVFTGSFQLSIQRPFIFVDIGANLFNAALLFAQHPLCKRVFSYEIIPDIYELGLLNLELNPRLRDKISTYDYGLYNVDKDIEVTYYHLRSGTSGISEKLQEEPWLANTTDNDFVTSDNRKHLIAPVKEAYPVIRSNHDHFPEDELVVKVDAENAEVEIVENLLPLFSEIYCFFVEFHSKSVTERLTSLFKDKNFNMEKRGALHVFYNTDRISQYKTREW